MAMFIGFGMTFTSCYTKKDTTAIVTVVDETSGNPVGGAQVTLTWAAADSTLLNDCATQTATTDAAGKAQFNYNSCYEAGQAGVMVMDILVNGDQVGIIKIEQETGNEETVEI